MSIDLKGPQRRYLMKMAHRLKPVVMIGKAGAEAPVVNALGEALMHHELVKAKFLDYKKEKRELADRLAGETEAALVQIIGNIAVFYKANPDKEDSRYTLPG